VVKRRAAMGDGEAQFTVGCLLVSRADGNAALRLGESGRSPMADVGLALPTYMFRVAHQTLALRGGHLLRHLTKCFVCRSRP